MADALKVNETVTKIGFGGECRNGDGEVTWKLTDDARACVGNHIGAEGGRAMAEALQVNRTVTQIVLSGE